MISYLRKKFLLRRKKGYLLHQKFNFNLIFKIIKKHFHSKKISIAGYYPSNYEVDILNFLIEASNKKFKILLPAVLSSTKMSFKQWIVKEPLYVSRFGILEPKKANMEITPDLVLVPLVAFDNNLNRIGYGKGYYDRKLKKIRIVKKKSVFLGVAHSYQKSKSIPVNNYDFKLDYIFTERGIISSKKV